MTLFDHIPLLPADPILGLPIAFNADKRQKKINLGIGAYKTAEGLPWVLSSVKKAEKLLLQQHLDKEYLPIEGSSEFILHSLKLLFGSQSPILQNGLYYSAQTVGGSSALRIAAEFLTKCSNKTIYLPQPTWANHPQIFERAQLNVGSYPYYNYLTHQLDFDGICHAIKSMEAKSIILLHGCCHNPTGLDPTFAQWQEIAALIKKQNVIPLFDFAYHGFGSDLTSDAHAIRYFAEQGLETIICYSYSKNFGLYGERVGFLTVCCSKKEQIPTISSQIKSIIRANYSSPPLHGERIVTTILKSLELTKEWENELNSMRERIHEMRKTFVNSLLIQGYPTDLTPFFEQKGLFCFLGLNSHQVKRLRDEKAIYMPSNGRITIARLTTQNAFEVAEAIMSVQ